MGVHSPETDVLLLDSNAHRVGDSLVWNGQYDICYVFTNLPPEKDSREMTSAEVQEMWMKICYVRSFENCQRNEEVVDSVKAIPEFYGLSRRRMKGMSEREFRSDLIKTFVGTLRNVLGCVVDVTKSIDNRVTFVRVALPEEKCQIVADSLKYPLQLDRLATNLNFQKINPMFVSPYMAYDTSTEADGTMACMKRIGRVWTRYSPNGHRIKSNHIDALDSTSCFKNVDTIRLLANSVKKLFNIHSLQELRFLKSAYPIHNERVLRQLESEWGTFSKVFSTSQPIEKIRKYFGEEVALYFDWMSLYTRSLYPIAIIGLIVGLLRLYFDPGYSFESPWLDLTRVAYGLVLATWVTYFDRTWKRRELLHSLRWGTAAADGYRRNVYERQEFVAEKWIKDPIQPDREIRYASKTKLEIRKIVSGIVSACSMIIVFLGTNERIHKKLLHLIGLPSADDLTSEFLPEAISGYLPGAPLVTTVSVLIFDQVFGFISTRLTDFENHQYEEDYSNSLVLKFFSFSALNYFAPLFYISIIKMYWSNQDETEGEVIKELRLQLLMLCGFMFASNLMELGWPFIKTKAKQMIHNSRAKKEGLQNSHKREEGIEVDYCKEEYNDTTTDWEEMAIQLFLMSFFSSALPILPAACVLVNHLEIRVDAVKLCRISRRIHPHPNKTIGAWSNVQTAVCTTAVLVNIVLAAFTTFGRNLPISDKLAVCVIALLVAFGGAELVKWMVPLESPEYQLLKRQQHVVLQTAIFGRQTSQIPDFMATSSGVALRKAMPNSPRGHTTRYYEGLNPVEAARLLRTTPDKRQHH